jgi:hypothetical protein
LFNGEGYTGAEFRIINRDGTEKWCWSAGSPLYDEDGVQVGVQIRDADISARKQAELRLRESEQRSRAIIETTSDAFLSADGNGVIQEWNRAAEAIFGVPRAEAIGANMFELVVTDSGREILERGLGSLGTDLVVRLGGDEFVLVLGDLPAESAANVASAVAARVHEGLSQPFQVAGTSFQTSASVGIALFPDDGSDPASLLTASDTGMYASKRAGRGRTSFPVGSRRVA